MSPSRLIRLLTILAVFFAPLSMLGGHAAMAMPASAQPMMNHRAPMDLAGHCADMDKQSKNQPSSSIDCMIACSGLLAAESAVAAHPMAASPLQPLALAKSLHGLNPESELPPPRLA